MKKKIDLFGIYLPFYLVTMLAAVTIRTIALFLYFDFKTGYFSEKTLINISDGILIVSVLFLFSYIFISNRSLKLIPSFTSPATYIPTGIVTISIVFMIFSLISRSLDTLKYMLELKKHGTPSDLSQIPSQRILLIILIITVIFAFLGIIHFLLVAVVESHSNTKRANFGICTVVFLSVYSLYLYFSNDLPINAPNKSLDQMAYLFSAAFFLYETRLSLGRERWRHYIAFGFIASLISAYAAIPSIIAYFSKGIVTANSVYELALTFALFVFITSRLFLTANLIENKESKTALAIMTASDLRDRQINPIPEKPEIIDVEGEMLDPAEEDDRNQLTIDDIGESKQNEPTEQSNPTSYETEDAPEKEIQEENAPSAEN